MAQGSKRYPTWGVYLPSSWRYEALKTQPLTPIKTPQTPYCSPWGQKKGVGMVGDTHEEFGFGFNIGLDLMIYVFKQPTNRWLPSQGSGEMGDYPTKQLGVRFDLVLFFILTEANS